MQTSFSSSPRLFQPTTSIPLHYIIALKHQPHLHFVNVIGLISDFIGLEFNIIILSELGDEIKLMTPSYGQIHIHDAFFSSFHSTWHSEPGTGEEVAAAVELALKGGYRRIDCAAAYENEADIGVALQPEMLQGRSGEEGGYIHCFKTMVGRVQVTTI